MKVYDCFMFSDEKMILDIRLNVLNEYVDHFIIVESKYKHNGDIKNKNFDINNYSKFKNKITYIYLDKEPSGLVNTEAIIDEDKKNRKLLHNTYIRENHQRDMIYKGLSESEKNDFIIIGDVDEIPNLKNFDFEKTKNEIIIFKQKMFYYKLNLFYKELEWTGSRACRKKLLRSPQWLRNVKDKKYPFWRPDIFFSKTKYKDIHFITNGGWHFSYMKTARDIEKKLKSYLHHREYDLDPIGEEKINKMINNKKPVYDLKTDMKNSKFKGGQELVVSRTDELPNYIKKNLNKYKQWLIEV